MRIFSGIIPNQLIKFILFLKLSEKEEISWALIILVIIEGEGMVEFFKISPSEFQINSMSLKFKEKEKGKKGMKFKKEIEKAILISSHRKFKLGSSLSR